ncbi:MAG: transketolase [Clostridiales bacterium]|jgi:transketolase|nr:transketolase [Clostridiales bacterium]
MTARALERISAQLRYDTVRMIHEAGDGHPAPALSCADLICALYFSAMRADPARPNAPDRDRLVLSKGHACPVLYAALARRGYFPVAELSRLRELGSMLQGHPDMVKTPGVDMTAGSLGHGISTGLGLAMASKYTGLGFRVYVITGDGEMEEGLIWEAAMTAARHGAGNLTVMCDCNNEQSGGKVADISRVHPLCPKFDQFGWHTQEIDGHDMPAILNALRAAQTEEGQPSFIACSTVKGKGVPFMEGDNSWHKRVPTAEQLEQARIALGVEA